MRVGLAVLFLFGIAIPPARAQDDAEAAHTIFLHPRVATILYFPDEIVDTWIVHDGEIRGAPVGNKLYLRPRPGTAAGVEASLEVHTRTVRRTFRLRVVARAKQAHLDVLVLLPEAAQHGVESTLEAPPVSHVEEESAVSATMTAPSAATLLAPPELAPAPVAPELAPAPAAPEPAPAPAAPDTARDIEPATERAAALGSQRFDISLHVVAAFGTTAFHVPGYDSISARQSHRAIGGRVAIHPRNTWWAVEASVTGEWPATPTTHRERGDAVLEVNGPRLRADVGLRGRVGTTLMPTLYAGLGLQAHHLDIEAAGTPGSTRHTGDLPFEGVLALGMGLEYRIWDVLLGIELHVRQGVLADYRSVGGLLSAGFILSQGD